MGVPKFYRWQSERYPCLSEIVKENQIPEFDNLYLDMNGIIHTCTHPNDEDVHFRMTEEQMFRAIFHYIEVLFRTIKPRKVFFMAVDGVAPRAKMNQQRGRRFRSANEAEEREKEAIKKGEKLPDEKRFDSNCITPGTGFMVRLQDQLKYFVNTKITEDTKWQGIRIFLSGHETPGEGEHKIMDFIRAEKARKGYDSNTRHCLYGLDADLMMLGLISHEPHFSLLREEVRFGKQAKRPTTVEETTFHLLHLSLFREYLALEFGKLKDEISWFNVENIIDDWVLLGFLVGNDFVPHLPDLHISHSALPLLYKTYIEVLPLLDGYLNEGGFLNLPRFEKFMKKLSKFDYDNFESQSIDFSFLEGKQSEDSWKSKKVEMKKAIREKLQEEIPGFMDMGWIENKAIDEASDEDSDDDEDVDAIELEFRMRKRDYYETKMGFRQITKPQRAKLVSDYIHALQWILHYYYNGIQSWSWYYPHHYAPYMSDLKDFGDLQLTYDKGEPFLPFQQLLAVLPPASKDHLPEAYWPLMTTDTSPIIEYYPLEFEQDLNGKLQPWEAVVLIPFIDETRLLAAMSMHEHKLKEGEVARNCHGPHHLYTTDAENPHTYQSSFQGTFPDIRNCLAKCEYVMKDAFQIDIGRLKKGLLEGVRLGVYFPGFPTLYHLNFDCVIRNAEVKVFQQLSRGENAILSIQAADPDPDGKRLAEKLLGETVYAEWPHLKEVKVVAVSDGEYRYDLVEDSRSVSASMQEVKLKPAEAEKWKRDCQTLGEEYFRRKGVNIGPTKVILYACPMLGRRYVCGHGGDITIEKQWTVAPVPYAYQVTLKDISVHDPSFKQFKTLAEIFPQDSSCFMLGMPNYGCQGKVVSTEKDRAHVLFSIPSEPNLDSLKANQHSHAMQYLEGYLVAQRVGISSMQVGRLTGSVYVTRGPRPSRSDEGFKGSSVNVGLNLKFNKQEQEVPGYTRKNEYGKWVYSYQLVDILDAYIAKFPQVVRFLNGKGFNDSLYEDEMFAGSDMKLEDVKKWIDEQPSSKAPKGKIGSTDLESPIVKLIQEEVAEFNKTLKVKKVKLSVRPHLLYRPMDGMGNLIPDPEASYELFDRVVNVREGFTVPLGLKGVVIGMLTGNTVLDNVYDVVFDEEFQGALELRCVGKRGYRIPPMSLINITYGQRKLKGQQKYEKTTAVVKPQMKQTNPNSGGHTQNQDYYQNRMARLGSPGASVGNRSPQHSGRGAKTPQNNQEESNQAYSRTKVREGAGGSPISYAAATNTSQLKAAVTPARQMATAQQPVSGMQGLGKIPGGKTDGRGERHQRGQRDSPVQEKRVTILRRDQKLSDIQPQKSSAETNPGKETGKRADPSPKVKKTVAKGEEKRTSGVKLQSSDKPAKQEKVEEKDVGSTMGSPSTRLPRLSTDGHGDLDAPVSTAGEEVDELSAIWQKLMSVQESPARREEKESGKKGEAEEFEEEFVSSVESKDFGESDSTVEEQDELERMTPNTYRQTQTEQLCKMLNISKTTESTDTAEVFNQKPVQESSASSRPGYTKQVSVAELFESAKHTAPHPRSPISLPQGGPMAQSKPLGQVAPNLQPANLAGPPLMAGQVPGPLLKPQQSPHQQAPARQPFMVHSPSKPQQMQSQAVPAGSMAPLAPPAPQRLQQSPQKPFMAPQGMQGAPHMGQGAPAAYSQAPYGAPPFRMPASSVPMHSGGPVPPMMQGHRYPPPPGQQGFFPGAMPPMAPPPGMRPGIAPGMAPAVDTLKGWCISQKLPPPKFTFQKTPQGVKALCTLGTGISYEGPPCPNESSAIERAAGVALNRLRIGPQPQSSPFIMPPMPMVPPGMVVPPGMNPAFWQKGMPQQQGYRQGFAPPMMAPYTQSQPQPIPPRGSSPSANWGSFVPLQVTKQLATTPTKTGSTVEPTSPHQPQDPTPPQTISYPPSSPKTISPVPHPHNPQVTHPPQPQTDIITEQSKKIMDDAPVVGEVPAQISTDGTKDTAQMTADGTKQADASSRAKHPRAAKKSSVKLAISFGGGK